MNGQSKRASALEALHKEAVGNATLYLGDCRDVLSALPANSVDAIVTDPPYELGFMGKKWDKSGIAFNPETWRHALRVLKPGGHMLAFGGSRTFHRIACAIEDAGFEIRDTIMWLYGSGMPKSKNLDGSWEGWGTALKPAFEPIILARKPLAGTVAANVMEHGTGALNIDACRVQGESTLVKRPAGSFGRMNDDGWQPKAGFNGSHLGRWPANIIHDGSEEVLAAFPSAPGQLAPVSTTAPSAKTSNVYGKMRREGEASAASRYTDAGGTNFAMMPGPRGGDPAGRWPANVIHDGSDEVLAAFPESEVSGSAKNGTRSDVTPAGIFGKRPQGRLHNDAGSAARFFYCAKASRKDRDEGLDAFDEVASRNYRTGNVHNGHGGRVPDKTARNTHPTVKPTSLMRYLCRLVTPPGGVVLDPFMGSGSTGKAAVLEDFSFIGVEQDEHSYEIAKARIQHAQIQHDEQPGTLQAELFT